MKDKALRIEVFRLMRLFNIGYKQQDGLPSLAAIDETFHISPGNRLKVLEQKLDLLLEELGYESHLYTPDCKPFLNKKKNG